ncbi:unnamed protein product [Paramecium sonneborni]|uniref:Uncharacterized protein n=1 Tax=Paramecium sonneborni TaxID=65129 RepID=A0A8S1RP98_9CILI|nr:unnamed protein product [Paramecium sonneborni]
MFDCKGNLGHRQKNSRKKALITQRKVQIMWMINFKILKYIQMICFNIIRFINDYIKLLSINILHRISLNQGC